MRLDASVTVLVIALALIASVYFFGGFATP
jgi:hypothetical protein